MSTRTYEKARYLYHFAGFEPREKYFLMSAFLSGTTAEIHAEAQIRAADAGGSELIDRASQEETS
jgi:hypothetical protein